MKKGSRLFLILLITAHVIGFILGLYHFTGFITVFTTGYLIHFTAFFVMSFILSVFLMQKGYSLTYSLNFSWIYSMLFSIFFEYMQIYFGRKFTPLGAVVGTIGSLSYCVIALIAFRHKPFMKWILSL
jgi:VanZ family protein